ncbi:MAG: flagellar motor switch protein FliN [Treponema sp.]|nr:flagellar motor switch protein FliN [Treponema sp.]
MSDGAISQDEIDALLSGVAIDGLNSSGHVGNGPAYHIDVPTLQKLAEDLKPKLEENINKYTGASFKVENPVTELLDRDRVLARLPEVVIAVSADYNEGIKGSHMYLLTSDFALKLFALVNNEEATDVDDMVLSVVSEIIATHISSQILILDQTGKTPGLAYSTPEPVNESKAMVMFPQGDFIFTSYPLTLDGNAYTLWECIGGDASEKISNALAPDTSADDAALLGGLGGMGASMNNMGGFAQDPMMNGGAMAGSGMSAPMGNPMGGAMANPMGGQMNAGMNTAGMGNFMGGQNMGMPQMGMPQMQMPQMGMANMVPQQPMNMMGMGLNVPNVQSLQYPSLQTNMGMSEQGNISLIYDVNMEMSVELGRTKKSIKEILGMGEGTIIELDKLAGEAVDILVNQKLIAKGEVVVIDENFGVRVTEIVSPIERVNELT